MKRKIVCSYTTNLVKSSSIHKRAITNRLWRYRKERQFSQRHVARLLGHRTTAQVSRWESGAKIPTLDNALLLAHILEAPVERLFADRAAELQAKIEARGERKAGA
jgi:Predicted transcriptional regulators